MRRNKYILLVILGLLLFSLFIFWFFYLRTERDFRLIKEGNNIVVKIETFRESHGRLPDSMKELGIEEQFGADALYYIKKNDFHYIIYFGEGLGDSMTYYSDSKQWEDRDRGIRSVNPRIITARVDARNPLFPLNTKILTAAEWCEYEELSETVNSELLSYIQNIVVWEREIRLDNFEAIYEYSIHDFEKIFLLFYRTGYLSPNCYVVFVITKNDLPEIINIYNIVDFHLESGSLESFPFILPPDDWPGLYD
jgi:hypothetical protein